MSEFVVSEKAMAELRGLVEKWHRESASVGHHRSISLCKALKSCADELEAALSAKGENEDTTHER